VGDDAEQVLGFGKVGLRLEGAAAQRLGFDEPALAAIAVGEHQRLAERHESLGRGPGELVHGEVG
jgi:hypothetical protein